MTQEEVFQFGADWQKTQRVLRAAEQAEREAHERYKEALRDRDAILERGSSMKDCEQGDIDGHGLMQCSIHKQSLVFCAHDANLKNAELRAALDRDKTGLAHALAEIVNEVKARRWVVQGRGDYAFDDDRYRQETGWALDAIEKLANDALAASGKLAHEALTGPRQSEKR